MARKMSIGCTDSCQCSRYSLTLVAGCVRGARRIAKNKLYAAAAPPKSNVSMNHGYGENGSSGNGRTPFTATSANGVDDGDGRPERPAPTA